MYTCGSDKKLLNRNVPKDEYEKATQIDYAKKTRNVTKNTYEEVTKQQCRSA